MYLYHSGNTLIFFNCMVYAEGKMSWMTTRKGKLQILPTINVPTIVPYSFNIFDTNNHDELDHFLSYCEIFYMFRNEIFPPDGTESEEYINILKINIHTIVSHPKLFPYNDVAR